MGAVIEDGLYVEVDGVHAAVLVDEISVLLHGGVIHEGRHVLSDGVQQLVGDRLQGIYWFVVFAHVSSPMCTKCNNYIVSVCMHCDVEINTLNLKLPLLIIL